MVPFAGYDMPLSYGDVGQGELQWMAAWRWLAACSWQLAAGFWEAPGLENWL
jgi:hypothetical protein